MKKAGKKAAVLVTAAMLGIAGMMTGCGEKGEETKQETKQETNAGPTTALDEADQEIVRKKAEENASTLVLTVGDNKVYMDTMLFFIYSMEAKGNYNDSYYQMYYETSFWDMEYEEGYTMRDLYKDFTMNSAVQYIVLADQANKNHVELNEEELEENKEYVNSVIEALTVAQIERVGFTRESLIKTGELMTLAEKYYQELIEGLDISLEEVRAEISKEDYKEYKTEYLYLSTSSYDADYNLIELTQEEKKANMEAMEALYQRLLDGTTMAELKAENNSLTNTTRTFLENSDKAEAEYREAAVKLAVGEYSKPVQTKYGIYIIKMLDDACTDSYEAAVEETYTERVNEAFGVLYEELEAQYEITVNEEVWGPLVFGNIVCIEETAE